MKYIKKFENINPDLIKKLRKNIINDNKVINGFNVYYDSMSGTVEWSNDNYIIYATPYWEDRDMLYIDMMNADGDEIDHEKIKLSTLKNEDDIKDFLVFYYKKIEKITSLLNERSELKKILKLLEPVSDTFLDRYNFYIKDIDPDQIPNSDIRDLLELFNKEYPHIIQSNKFNL
jgi:hypothetical protein